MNIREKYEQQIGANVGTAMQTLKRYVMYDLGCSEPTITVPTDECGICHKPLAREDMSLEHKIPWRNAPNAKELFWDLGNIGFAHKKCNLDNSRTMQAFKARGHYKPGLSPDDNHGTTNYRKGCRCDVCSTATSTYMKAWRERNKNGSKN